MRVARFLSAEAGSQLVEFAVSLPLLAVFVVGIFDFGNAFIVKQKVSDAARDGARIGSNLPSGVSTSFSAGGPILTADIIRDAVDRSLTASRLNSCGLNSASGAQQGTALTWVYTASGNGCAGTLTLTVKRALPVAASVGGNAVNVLSTQVQLSYPYRWQFNRVITLVAPGATYQGITQITDAVTVPNLD